jgi:thioredoxin-dependent peroxiredoxin
LAPGTLGGKQKEQPFFHSEFHARSLSVSKKTASKSAKKTVAKKAAKKVVKKPLAQKVAKKVAKKPTVKKSVAKTAATSNYRIKAGDQAPAFEVPSTSGKTIGLSDFKGKNLVLYFYPKDNTPGCTLEGHDFKKMHSAFKTADCEILGVSQDSIKSHDGFRKKCGFTFDLLSDEDGKLCRAFDVIQMKNMYGRKFEGIERSTFVIDKKGLIRGEWRKVKVDGHAKEVLDFVKTNLS